MLEVQTKKCVCVLERFFNDSLFLSTFLPLHATFDLGMQVRILLAKSLELNELKYSTRLILERIIAKVWDLNKK